MKECIMNNMKKAMTCKTVLVTAAAAAGAFVGTAVGLGVNIKISKKVTPVKKGISVALSALGDMMTSISENL